MSATSPVSAPAVRGYRWGKLQGWATFALGVSFVLTALWAKHIPGVLAGIVVVLTGLGLVKRRKYAVVLLWLQSVLVVLAGFSKPPSATAAALHLFLLGFWVVPAVLYYPKRWKEFR